MTLIYYNYNIVLENFGSEHMANIWYDLDSIYYRNEICINSPSSEKLSKILNNDSQEYLFLNITDELYRNELNNYWDQVFNEYADDFDDDMSSKFEID